MRATVRASTITRAGRKTPDDDQRCADPEPCNERRRECGPDPHESDPEHLDHAEDTCHYLVGNRALNQRQASDVDEGVPDADDEQRGYGDGDFLPESSLPKRQPREDESDEEGGAQPLRSGQRQGADGAEECPDADRRVQIADASVAEVEEGRVP